MTSFKKKVCEKLLYCDGLKGEEKIRYDDKLKLLGGTDPYEINKWSIDISLLPPLTYIDIVNYLLLTPSPYSKDDLKRYKSLDAYNQFENGLVREKSATECNGYTIVTAKVLHSQHMNDKPLQPWIVCDKSGTVKCTHCNCMAGLGEACPHVTALLFCIDATVRIRGSKTLTDDNAYQQLPTAMRKVQCNEIKDIDLTSSFQCKELKDIDFTSDSTAKRKFEQSLDCRTLPVNSNILQTPKISDKSRNRKIPSPTSEEIKCFFKKLSKLDSKPVILSVVAPYCDAFIPKAISEDLPLALCDLGDESCCKMNTKELQDHCKIVFNKVKCSDEQRNSVDLATRDQTLSKFWYSFCTGRVTASKAHSVCTTNHDKPSLSLIKEICYPDSGKFQTAATKWCVDKERTAMNAFNIYMNESHERCFLDDTGLLISSEHPYIVASPDSLFSCDCCGEATVEVKCPFSLRNDSLDSCEYLEENNGIRQLKPTHHYFYEVQCQLGCANLEFGYFVVWTEQDIHVEQILFDPKIWEEITSNANIFFLKAVLPELVGKYYTRQLDTSESQLESPSGLPQAPKLLTPSTADSNNVSANDLSQTDDPLYCFCQTEEHGKMVCCDNENCKYQWFHFKCVGLKRKPRGKWYCGDCI